MRLVVKKTSSLNIYIYIYIYICIYIYIYICMYTLHCIIVILYSHEDSNLVISLCPIQPLIIESQALTLSPLEYEERIIFIIIQ